MCTQSFGRCRCAWRNKCNVWTSPRKRGLHRKGEKMVRLVARLLSPLGCRPSKMESWRGDRGAFLERKVNDGLLQGRSGLLLGDQRHLVKPGFVHPWSRAD